MKSNPLSKADDDAAKLIGAMSKASRKHYRNLVPEPGMGAVLAMAIGWGIRCCRNAKAIVVLYRYDYEAEVSPLLRSLMEHSTKMQWLVETKGEALKAIEFAHRKHQRLLKESADKGGWDLDQEGKELPPSDLDMEKPDELGTFDNFKELVEKHTSASHYAVYQLESALSHPTYLSGAIYFDPDQQDLLGNGLKWVPPDRAVALRVTAAWLLLALGAIRTNCTPPDGFGAVLDDVEAKMKPEP